MNELGNDLSLFERLEAGLKEGIRFARGETSLKTTVIPSPPQSLKPQEITRLRKKLQLSQGTFAGILNVSPKTVQNWKQGRHKVSQAALRLLRILEAEPEIVCSAVGISTVGMKKNGKHNPRKKA